MRSRHFSIVLVTAATLVVASASAAGAFSGRAVASWQMNERPGARTMLDSSGHGQNGRIGREVTTGARTSGVTGYRFARLDPDTPPTHPQHLVTVDDDGDLDPGTRDYAVTMR